MAERWLERDLTRKVTDILSHAEACHETYYAVETFGGPSLHFHRRALGLDGELTQSQQHELIYAALTSWGMHRMGSKGSKMRAFDEFQSSVDPVRGTISELALMQPNDLDSGGWAALEHVFKQVTVMFTKTTLVGNSKVLAHLLPNLVVPVDREYTLNYLFGSTMFQNDLVREWNILRKILSEFFYPIAADSGFQRLAAEWMSKPETFQWDTSPLKIVDNLVIGRMKLLA